MKKIYAPKVILIAFIAIFVCTGIKENPKIKIVAAENIYGQVAKELGGQYVDVISIINNPFQDPHLFATTPSHSVAVSQANVVIFNGADYDPWMNPMLSGGGREGRQVINVASLLNIKQGDNPHIWYLPSAIPTVAKELVNLLSQLDPTHQSYYEENLNRFNSDYQIIYKKIDSLKQRFQGVPITATEPVFTYMAKSIGLQIRGEDFQVHTMNDVPPTIALIKMFEDDLRNHSVRVLIYNDQVHNTFTERMLSIAKSKKIPVVGVSETLPSEMTYIQWIIKELDDLETALESPTNDES